MQGAVLSAVFISCIAFCNVHLESWAGNSCVGTTRNFVLWSDPKARPSNLLESARLLIAHHFDPADRSLGVPNRSKSRENFPVKLK
jgi:hypothetical protein